MTAAHLLALLLLITSLLSYRLFKISSVKSLLGKSPSCRVLPSRCLLLACCPRCDNSSCCTCSSVGANGNASCTCGHSSCFRRSFSAASPTGLPSLSALCTGTSLCCRLYGDAACQSMVHPTTGPPASPAVSLDTLRISAAAEYFHPLAPTELLPTCDISRTTIRQLSYRATPFQLRD